MVEKTNENAKNQQIRSVLTDEEGLRLDRWFKRHFPALSHGELQKWLRTGQIRVEGKRVDSSFRLMSGAAIRLPPQLWKNEGLTRLPVEGKPIRHAEKLKKLILFEDSDVVVLNKPPGLAVQGGTGLKENLDDSLMALSADGKTKPKLVHRLDRDTSGVLLIARNDYAAMKLAASFRSRETKKIYWALCKGVPKPEFGEIDAPLVKSGQIMRIATPQDNRDDTKTARTLYNAVERAGKNLSFVVLWPLTGRTHQLRVHMAYIKTPIWDDPLYGDLKESSENLSFGELGSGLHLHARRLIIPHPRRGVIDVVAPLPPAMRKSWRWLGFDDNDTTDFSEEDV